MSKPKAIVTRRWPTANEERLKEHFDVTFNDSDVPFTNRSPLLSICVTSKRTSDPSGPNSRLTFFENS